MLTILPPALGLLLLLGACFLFRIEGSRRIRRAEADVRNVALEQWPRLWLLVRTRRLDCVKAALGLRNAKPCSWRKGLASPGKVFLTRAVKGWVLVTGAALPDPTDDVDACFRFVQALSKRLGQVQLFSADRALGHHAWVKVKRGRIVRAYVWAGNTLWNQGAITAEERELNVYCREYAQDPEFLSLTATTALESNCEKVGQLAACWSLSPAELQHGFAGNLGIAGEPSKGV